MTHAPLRSFCATTAICAVLALGSTPALAQEAAPPLDVPAAAVPAGPPAAAQPTIQIQLPAEPAAPQPVAEQAAPSAAAVTRDDPAPAKSSAQKSSAQSRQASRPAAHAVAAAPVPRAEPAQQSAAAPVTPEPLPPAASVPLAQPAVTPPPAMTASQEEAQVASADDGLLSPGMAIAGLLAALGLGAGALALTRGSRRRREDEYEAAYEAEPEPERVQVEPELPLPAYAMIPEEPAALALEPTPHPTVAQRIGSEELAPAAGPERGLAPNSREERDALLEQMVAAEPDAENPFTSHKGRLRRARLILQAREHAHNEAAENAAETQPFDWRTYGSSTSNPAPATPPRVTV